MMEQPLPIFDEHRSADDLLIAAILLQRELTGYAWMKVVVFLLVNMLPLQSRWRERQRLGVQLSIFLSALIPLLQQVYDCCVGAHKAVVPLQLLPVGVPPQLAPKIGQ